MRDCLNAANKAYTYAALVLAPALTLCTGLASADNPRVAAPLAASVASAGANANCAQAVPVQLGVPMHGSNVGAATTLKMNCQGAFDDIHDVWYRFTAPESKSYRISLCGSGFDTTLGLFANNCNSFTQLACNDDGCEAGGPSELVATLTASQTYLIRVSGWGGASGSFTLSVNDADAPMGEVGLDAGVICGNAGILDPSFEGGTPSEVWNEYSTAFGSPLCTTDCGKADGLAQPRSGAVFAWFGGVPTAVEDAFLEQPIALPPDHMATLRFFLAVEALGAEGYLRVFLNDTFLWQVTQEDAPAYGAYTPVEVDLSDYADGEERTLRFEARTLPAEDVLNFIVDDVCIVVAPIEENPEEGEPEPTPEGEDPPTPEGETTPMPEGETTPTPEGETTPEGEAPPTPEGETTPTPEGEDTPAPEGETTPEGEDTPAPEGETTPTPEGETTPAPEGETTPTPEGETTPMPEGEDTPTPEGENTPAPEGETTPTPEGETTPEGEAPPAPEGEDTPTPEGEDTPTPEGETTPTPEGENTPAPEGETTPTPEGETTPMPEGEDTPTPEGETTPTPEGETTPTPEGETTPTPEGETTPTPEGETTPTPEGETTPTPEGETTPTPEGEDTPTPEGETTPMPEGEDTPTPEGENTPTPEGETTPMPEGEDTPTPEGENTPTPEGETTPTPEGEDNPAPEGETTPTPEGETAPTPEGEPEEDDPEDQPEESTSAPHSADQNKDERISLSELLRVIQFFNSSGLHCAASGEDGFAPGRNADKQSCAPHQSDYQPQDWRVSLSELLRLIQFFNSTGYQPCESGEDGFCPKN